MMTATDWRAAGAAAPEAGRRAMRQMLEASGLVLDSADYNAAVRDFKRGQAEAAALRRAAAEASERLRIAPFLAEARDAVMAWGCVEDGGSTAAEIEEMVRDEAARLADELERVEREIEERAEREAEELEEYLLKQNGLRRALAAAESLVREAAGWRLVSRRCGSDSSHYFWLFFGGESEADWEERIGLRISDHYAPNGSGWNELTQDRHPEPDINIVIRRGVGGEYTFDLTPLVGTISR